MPDSRAAGLIANSQLDNEEAQRDSLPRHVTVRGDARGCRVLMGCVASKDGTLVLDENATEDADAEYLPADLNPFYKRNYAPEHDDKEGKPLSSLIACPALAMLYNAGQITCLADKVAAAEAEDFADTGWGIPADTGSEAPSAHQILYDARVPSDEFVRALRGANFHPAVAKAVTGAVESDPAIFQLQNAAHKHGEAT